MWYEAGAPSRSAPATTTSGSVWSMCRSSRWRWKSPPAAAHSSRRSRTDVPDADVAIVVGGALGEREHVQRIGRLLRPRPDKRALVYELLSRRTLEESVARRRRAGLAARAPHRP